LSFDGSPGLSITTLKLSFSPKADTFLVFGELVGVQSFRSELLQLVGMNAVSEMDLGMKWETLVGVGECPRKGGWIPRLSTPENVAQIFSWELALSLSVFLMGFASASARDS